jgi:hypothetical protein
MKGFEWPVDETGKAMALVTNGCSEKIGLPKFSNVDVGPCSVTRFVKDDPAVIVAALKENLEICEQVLGEEREAILQLVNASGA